MNEKRRKYARLLREGRTEEATALVTDEGSNTEKTSEETEEEEEDVDTSDILSEEERFADLKGVGDELADELVEEFGTFSSFKDASVEDLEPIPGIGEKRAESLLEQVE